MDYKSHIIRSSERRGRRSVLLKGSSGTGKTYQFRNLLEGGLKGLYVRIGEHSATIDDIEYDEWPVEKLDIPLMPAAKKPEQQDFIAMADFIRSDQHDYDFIYVDSLMYYADALLVYLKHTVGLSGYDLWGVYGEKMRTLLRVLTSLTKSTHIRPVNVIATWGVETGVSWEGHRAIVPIVDGKMVGPRIDYCFDDVLMLRKQQDAATGDIKFIAYTTGTHEFDAKVSSGKIKLPPIWSDPNLYRFLVKLGVVESSSSSSKTT